MNRKKAIQFKAAILLIVFSLNTVIGFACVVGLDMGFNSHHHKKEAMESTEGQHHQTNNDKVNCCNNKKDNCCNDGVMKFQQIDKNIVTPFSLTNTLIFTLCLASGYNIDILSSNSRISGIKYFVRSHHPPIPDIRIAIQSFQI